MLKRPPLCGDALPGLRAVGFELGRQLPLGEAREVRHDDLPKNRSGAGDDDTERESSRGGSKGELLVAEAPDRQTMETGLVLRLRLEVEEDVVGVTRAGEGTDGVADGLA